MELGCLKRLNLFQVNFRCHYEACRITILGVQMCCLVSLSQEYLVDILGSYKKQEREGGRFPFEKL